MTLQKIGRKFRISCVVEELAMKHYKLIRDMSMRNSYYFIRAKLDIELSEGKITDEEYQYFMDHYNDQYACEWWPKWEKKYGVSRPDTKDSTRIWWNGIRYESEEVYRIIERARGFIFVEKEGMAKELIPLTKSGYILLAGEGQPTRIVRERLKQAMAGEEERPIITLCDCDMYGSRISQVFELGSRRTSHLDLIFDNFIDLGLTPEQAQKLGLPDEKVGDTRRTELNAFVYLEEKYGLKEPFLTFVLQELQKYDKICKLPTNWKKLLKFKVKRRIEDIFSDFVYENIDAWIEEPTKDIDKKEECVSVNLPEIDEEESDEFFNDIYAVLKAVVKYLVEGAEKVNEDEAQKDNIERMRLDDNTSKFIKDRLN